MVNLNRRHLLSLVAGSSALSIAACSAMSMSAVITTVADDVNIIATGLLGVLPTIGTIVGVNPEMVATIGSAIADLQSLAQQIKVTTDITVTQTLVQQVEADVNVIVNALAGIRLLPPPVSLALQAVVVLLPVIEMAINMIVRPKLTARAAKVHMTPEQARANLRSLAPHK